MLLLLLSYYYVLLGHIAPSSAEDVLPMDDKNISVRLKERYSSLNLLSSARLAEGTFTYYVYYITIQAYKLYNIRVDKQTGLGTLLDPNWGQGQW